MPPSYVKGYVKRSKSDAADAAAICEAVTRPSMRFVPIKSTDQQALLMLYRTRDLLIRQRTQLINVRAHLAEFGLIAEKGREGLAQLGAIIADGRASRLLSSVMIAASCARPSRPVSATRPDSARWARSALISCVR